MSGKTLTPAKRVADIEPNGTAKRKRYDREAETEEEITRAESKSSAEEQSSIENVYTVLSLHNAASDILDTDIEQASNSTNGETNSKICYKIKNHEYISLGDLYTDVEAVCNGRIAKMKQSEEGDGLEKRLNVDEIKKMQDIMDFQSFTKNIVDRESRQRQVVVDNGQAKTVLTLFGNVPPNGRQLFSSLQSEMKKEMTLEELGLPSMLVASKIIPVSGNENTNTIKNTFTLPSSTLNLRLPSLQYNPTLQKNPTLSFVDLKTKKINKKEPYILQALNTGQWLKYGGGNARTKHSETDSSLFTSAYSSFGPSHDNNKSVLSNNIRDLAWWEKKGRYKISGLFDVNSDGTNGTKEVEMVMDTDTNNRGDLYEKLLEVDDFDTQLDDDDDDDEQQHSVNYSLGEINDLLQTLASHQRIRHISTSTTLSEDELSVYSSIKTRLFNIISFLPPYIISKLDGQQFEELLVPKSILLFSKHVKGVLEEDQACRMARSAAAAVASIHTANSISNSKSINNSYSKSSISSSKAINPQVYQAGHRNSLGYSRQSSSLIPPNSASTPSRPYQPPQFNTAPVNRTLTANQPYSRPIPPSVSTAYQQGGMGMTRTLSRQSLPGPAIQSRYTHGNIPSTRSNSGTPVQPQGSLVPPPTANMIL